LRILFVTPYVPSEVRIRPFAFIRELARMGHQVTLACLVQPAWESKYISQVASYCQSVHPVFLGKLEPYLHALASLPTKLPLSVAYCKSTEFEKLIRSLVHQGSYDLIHTEFVRAAPVTMNLTGIPKSFDAVDSLFLAYQRGSKAPLVSLWQKLIYLIESIKMKDYELKIQNHYDGVMVSSPIDQKVLQNNGQQVSIIPNGVDLKFFSFQESPKESRTIIFLGKMSYYVNVASVLWFYQEVFPLIRQKRSDVKLKIIGRNPVSAISALSSDPAVEVTGTVPDVRPHLAQGMVSICPMICGSGIQNKLLEAMAVGNPCVATPIATQGISVKHGTDVLVAENPDSFANAVLELIEQPSLRHRIAENARYYVEGHHSWDRIGDRLDQFYNELLSSYQNRSH